MPSSSTLGPTGAARRPPAARRGGAATEGTAVRAPPRAVHAAMARAPYLVVHKGRRARTEAAGCGKRVGKARRDGGHVLGLRATMPRTASWGPVRQCVPYGGGHARAVERSPLLSRTGTLACSVMPRPVAPRTPMDMDSSTIRRYLYLSFKSTCGTRPPVHARVGPHPSAHPSGVPSPRAEKHKREGGAWGALERGRRMRPYDLTQRRDVAVILVQALNDNEASIDGLVAL